MIEGGDTAGMLKGATLPEKQSTLFRPRGSLFDLVDGYSYSSCCSWLTVLRSFTPAELLSFG